MRDPRQVKRSGIVRVRVRISGRVQGVNYRTALARRAELLELAGVVRNLSDGSVEAFLEGPQAAVGEIVEWCWEGPPAAQVSRVEQMAEPVLGEIGFRIES